MVGSRDSISACNVVLNTITAEVFRDTCDRLEAAENLEMAGGIEAEDDYNEQNDMMETDEEPFDMEKDQNPMRLSTRSNGLRAKRAAPLPSTNSVST